MRNHLGERAAGRASLYVSAAAVVIALLALVAAFTHLGLSVISPSATKPTNIWHNQTVYQNQTIWRNTTNNITQPIWHNTTQYQNTTVVKNNTIWHNQTVYVNTTIVELIPVVNITAINLSVDWRAGVTASLLTPHNYTIPVGTDTYALLNVTNHGASSVTIGIRLNAPFVFLDSQPRTPFTLGPHSSLVVSVTVGVPFGPGAYALSIVLQIS